MTADTTNAGRPMQFGSSGATFDFVGDRVIKRGDWRVGKQGAWLAAHPLRHTPRVYVYDERSYEMEALKAFDGEMHVGEWTSVMASIWSQPGTVPFDIHIHAVKLEQIADEFAAEMFTWLRRIDWMQQRVCLTHGDPTYENFMVRPGTNEFVAIDPLPGTLSVPDLRCVDLGKYLQSAVGWEWARYGIGARPLPPSLPVQYDWAEADAAWYWCAVHLLRTLPYVDQDVRTRVKDLVADVIVRCI